MAKHAREVRRMHYMDQFYPLVFFGMVQMNTEDFLQHYQRHMINEFGICTDDDITWAKQYIAKFEADNHA